MVYWLGTIFMNSLSFLPCQRGNFAILQGWRTRKEISCKRQNNKESISRNETYVRQTVNLIDVSPIKKIKGNEYQLAMSQFHFIKHNENVQYDYQHWLWNKGQLLEEENTLFEPHINVIQTYIRQWVPSCTYTWSGYVAIYVWHKMSINSLLLNLLKVYSIETYYLTY